MPPSVRTCGGSSTIAKDMRCVNSPRSKRREASPCKASQIVPSTIPLSSGITLRDSAKATRSLAFAPPVPMRAASLSKSRTRDRTRLMSSRLMTSPASSSTASSLLAMSAKSLEGRSIHFRISLPPMDVTVRSITLSKVRSFPRCRGRIVSVSSRLRRVSGSIANASSMEKHRILVM